MWLLLGGRIWLTIGSAPGDNKPKTEEQCHNLTNEGEKIFSWWIIPFYFKSQNGKPDMSFFAVDCFHFSDRGYAEMAMALWNNMVSGCLRSCLFGETYIILSQSTTLQT